MGNQPPVHQLFKVHPPQTPHQQHKQKQRQLYVSGTEIMCFYVVRSRQTCKHRRTCANVCRETGMPRVHRTLVYSHSQTDGFVCLNCWQGKM